MLERLLASLLANLRDYFDFERLGVLLSELLVKIVMAAIVMTRFYLLWRVLDHIVSARLKRRFDKTSVAFAETVLNVSLFGLGVIAALGAAGVKTTALLGSLGVAGLTLGFALRDTLSNIISGILVFMDRPFAKRAELREKAFKALTAAGVEMPFETIQLAPHRVSVGMTPPADAMASGGR